MPVTVDIPEVGSVDFPDEMGMEQIQAAVAKLHSQHAPAVSEPRVPIGVDPRMEPDTMFSRDEWAPAGAAAASALGTIGMMQVGGPVGRVLASPVGGGLATAATALLHGQSVEHAAAEGILAGAGAKYAPGFVKALTARLAHKLIREAVTKAAPTAVEAVEKAAPAVGRAYQGIPSLMKVAAPVAEDAAAVASAADASRRTASLADLMKAPASVAPEAAPVAAKAMRAAVPDAARVGSAARAEDYAAWVAEHGGTMPLPRPTPPFVEPKVSVPVKGQSRMPTTYSRPAGAPPTKSEASSVFKASVTRNLKEEQLAAAKAAGVDLGEAFGGQTQQAAESALETRLRASVLMKKDPAALATEIEGRVMSLGKVSPEKAAQAVEEIYGLSASTAKDMVEMIFKTHGVR